MLQEIKRNPNPIDVLLTTVVTRLACRPSPEWSISNHEEHGAPELDVARHSQGLYSFLD